MRMVPTALISDISFMLGDTGTTLRFGRFQERLQSSLKAVVLMDVA
jgi:hypothetical protein